MVCFQLPLRSTCLNLSTVLATIVTARAIVDSSPLFMVAIVALSLPVHTHNGSSSLCRLFPPCTIVVNIVVARGAGERQLLCIARALLRRSKLVCVDEATSRVSTFRFARCIMMYMLGTARGRVVHYHSSSKGNACQRNLKVYDTKLDEQKSDSVRAADNCKPLSPLLCFRDLLFGAHGVGVPGYGKPARHLGGTRKYVEVPILVSRR